MLEGRKKKKIASDQNGAVFQLFLNFLCQKGSSSVFSPKFSFPRGEGVLFSCELGTFLVPTLEYVLIKDTNSVPTLARRILLKDLYSTY